MYDCSMKTSLASLPLSRSCCATLAAFGRNSLRYTNVKECTAKPEYSYAVYTHSPSIQSVIRCSTLTIDNVSGSVGEAHIKVTRVHEMHQRDIACAGRVSRCRERALAGRSLELRQCTSSDTRQESTQYQNRNDASRGTRPSHGTFYTVLHVGCCMDSSPVCHTAHRLDSSSLSANTNGVGEGFLQTIDIAAARACENSFELLLN